MQKTKWLGWCMAVGLVVSTAAMASTRYKPFVLGHEDATSSMSEAVTAARAALTTNGFQVVGQYVPFAHTTILCATYPELLNAAAHARHGSFGAVERISVTRLNGKLQVSYENPQYTAVAYGLGALPKTTAALKAALGAEQVFGSARGLTRDELEPGEYHYALFMPYFNDIYRVGKFANHAAAVNTIRTNLMKHVATTSLVYEVNVPGTKEPTTVFGIGIKSGTAGDYHILNLIDQHPLRGYAYLPYEMMVVGRRVISLRPRFRIAVNFPDTSMMGSHGFMSIIDAPGAIRHVLDQVAGQNDN